MPPVKAHELYSSFEDWVRSHKFSSLSVSCVLEDSMAASGGDPVEDLKSYISRLQDLRSEIGSEISEARDWIRYFRRPKR